MPLYEFSCANHGSEPHVFTLQMNVSDYVSNPACPDCGEESQRVFGSVAVQSGRTAAQKAAGTSKRTIDYGNYMKEQREQRKKNYGPNTREGQSNELWTGNEVKDGVIKGPDANHAGGSR